MATDLPEPVVPATSRCGILARSTMTGSPPMVLPSAIASRCFEVSKSWLASSSRRYTVSRRWLGSSMPMALRPCTTATRAEIDSVAARFPSEATVRVVSMQPEMEAS